MNCHSEPRLIGEVIAEMAQEPNNKLLYEYFKDKAL